MSNSGPNFGQQQSEFAHLESIVQAAGRYVQPTEDLRPNALEAAQSAYRQRRTNTYLGCSALFVLLVAVIGIPDYLISPRLGPAFVESSDLHHRAAQNVVEGSVGTNWALYEVFSEFRREQAELLQHSD